MVNDKPNIDLDSLTTETRNPHSQDLDALETLDLVRLINAEDAGVAAAIAPQAPAIARAIDVIAERLQRGGRLIYAGAGTSGRLGVLDAAECPPTFNADPGQVIGLIAGGAGALLKAVEGAEDSLQAGADDCKALNLSERDVLVGIAASGRTPYVIGALDHARDVGAFAIGFSCNAGAELHAHADLNITPVVGPEVLTGSTRMKAGTATKMVLNMLSTGAMVRLGKTFGNLMVDVQATNAKLVERSIRIVRDICACSREAAEQALSVCDGELKTAVLSELTGEPPGRCRQALGENGGRLRDALHTLGHDDGVVR